MVLEQYESALRMRQVIASVAKQVVNRERPTDKIARVVDLDRSAGIAYVVYAGDEVNSVRITMYPGCQPQGSDRSRGVGNGSIVRVSGSVGSRYLAEVLSDAPHQSSPRLYNPMISSSGDMENSLNVWITLQTTGVPPNDGATYYYTGEVTFPLKAGLIEVSTEMLLADGTAYQQIDKVLFDNSAAKDTPIAATTDSTTSTGMALSYFYTLTDGAASGNPGALNVILAQRRGTASTKSPVSSNIMLRCFGSNIALVRVLDSTVL